MIGLLLAAVLASRPAHVVSVHDCDTFTVTVDLGYGVGLTGALRLYGVSAPEVTGSEKPKGLLCLQQIAPWIKVGDHIELGDMGKDKYGRLLGTVRTAAGLDLAAQEISAGLAKPWDGTGAAPRFPLDEPYPLIGATP